MSQSRVLVGLEMQIPYESPKLFDGFVEFAVDFKPDRIVIIGDFLDVPGPSRWNRGTVLEFAGSLQKECNRGRDYLRRLRGTLGNGVVIGFHEGNHEERIASYIRNKAPAFGGLDALRIPSLLGFDELEIDLLASTCFLARGWVTTHGHAIARTVSPTAGGTALIQARRIGRSVVCGHTHRLGLICETSHGTVVTGVETGHMMDTGKASYVQYPNWQAGFAAFEIEDQRMKNIRLVKMNRDGGIFW